VEKGRFWIGLKIYLRSELILDSKGGDGYEKSYPFTANGHVGFDI
jgi:hypothetical protein